MDFDDLLTVTVRLFRTCPDVLEHYQQRFEHILVDEYQDTNRAQNELVLLLAGGPPQRHRRRRQRPVPAAGHARRHAERSAADRGRCSVGDVVLGTDGGTRAASGPSRGRQAARTPPARSCGSSPEGASCVGTPHHLVPARLTTSSPAGTSSTSCTGPTGATGSGARKSIRRNDRGGRAGGLSRAAEPGARRRALGAAGVRLGRRGRLLGGVLRRVLRACPPRASTASAASSPSTRPGSSGSTSSWTRTAGGQAADGRPAPPPRVPAPPTSERPATPVA